MGSLMRAAVIDQPGSLTLREIEIPSTSGDEVHVKVSANRSLSRMKRGFRLKTETHRLIYGELGW